MAIKFILCDYTHGKEVSDNVYGGKVPDSANAMGVVGTIQALLSFVVRLFTGLPGILTLKINVGTQPLCNLKYHDLVSKSKS